MTTNLIIFFSLTSGPNIGEYYNDSPYIFGDTVKGNYDKQSFDLNAKITRRFGNSLAAGVGINYFAADVSRIRDPRTRTFVANYGINPGVVFRLNNQSEIGINGGLGFEKEKMPSIITVQTDPKIDYYFFLGNENTYAVPDGYIGFDRQYITFSYHAALQHAVRKENWTLFNALSFKNRTQQILGSERQSPGGFQSQQFTIDSKFNYRFPSALMLAVQLNAYFKQGTADEFLQERVEVRDTVNGSTSRKWNTVFTYDNRYSTDSYGGELRIDMRKLIANATDYGWLLGTRLTLNGFNNRYYLPFSAFESQNVSLGMYGTLPVMNRRDHRFNIGLSADYGWALVNQVQLNGLGVNRPSSGATNFETATYKIAQNIILHDAQVLNQKNLDMGMSANYSFPIQLKNNKFAGQIKVFYNYVDAQSLGNNNLFGVSLGLFSF